MKPARGYHARYWTPVDVILDPTLTRIERVVVDDEGARLGRDPQGVIVHQAVGDEDWGRVFGDDAERVAKAAEQLPWPAWEVGR